MKIFTITTVHAYSDGVGPGGGRNCQIFIDHGQVIDCMREFRDAFEADLERYGSEEGQSPIRSVSYTEFYTPPHHKSECVTVARLSVKFYGEKKEMLITASQHWRSDIVRGVDE